MLEDAGVLSLPLSHKSRRHLKPNLFLFFALFLLASSGLCAQEGDFDRWFDGRTLRLDCLREGSAEGDTVWVERWRDRGSQWHGSRNQLLDPFNNGDYRVKMRDAATGRLIYSRGYNTLFGEYRNTPEGQSERRRFQETLLLPMPRRAVHIALQKRDTTLRLANATVMKFDPAELDECSEYSEYSAYSEPFPVSALSGDPSRKVDMVFVMQGYAAADTQCRADARRIADGLFSHEPFSSHRDDFNLYAVVADVGADYGTFGADRYLMTFDLWRLHDAVGTTPCDYIVIVVNDARYGGGAIYNFYATTSLNRQAEFVLPHELGHAIGGLADEYVDESLSYGEMHRMSREPLEPNITNLVDFASKWQSLLPPGTPVPTSVPSVPRNECGPLGVYEGAGYAPKGIYRPTPHCMMRDYAPFCPVCSRRLEEVFSYHCK